jgi:hypothetical protein
MNIKEIAIWLFVFIIGSLIVSFLISQNSFTSFKNNIQSIKPSLSQTSSENSEKVLIDFEDYQKNPNKYVGQIITVRGEYYYQPFCTSLFNSTQGNPATNCYNLRDKNDYYITIVPKIDRPFEKGKTYTFTGKIVKILYDSFCEIKKSEEDCIYHYYLVEE